MPAVDIAGAVLAVVGMSALSVALFGVLPILEEHLLREDVKDSGPAPRH
jgi:hypothetical protein